MGNEDKMTIRKTKDTNDMYNSPFATRLRSLIEENNLTQAAVAQEMNTTRQTISMFEIRPLHNGTGILRGKCPKGFSPL